MVYWIHHILTHVLSICNHDFTFINNTMIFKYFDKFSSTVCCQEFFPVFIKCHQLPLKSVVAEEADL